MQLPANRILLNGSIFCNQPAKMPKETYDIYFRFLRRWYMDNDFIPFEPDIVYVSTNDEKGMAIDTADIVSLMEIDNDLTEVMVKEKETDIMNQVVIKENIEYFKKRVYIF